jgi:hypothetical protein
MYSEIYQANSRSTGEFELLMNSTNHATNNRGDDDDEDGAKNLSASLYGSNDGRELRYDGWTGVISMIVQSREFSE